ncbi:MAG: toll/interleukin-1 receptor domain-containing protein [Oscillospiraceae bacterium]|nr:toll/interleukin-1 receptor domain-containing protein [Oscillospiraceae bacterium]
MNTEKKYDVFISYRRDGGQETARILRDSLTERGYRVFFDLESLRSGAFNTKLYSVIEECTDFVLVLSPHALDRCVNPDDWVRQEVEHALRKKKNVIPILLRNFEFPAQLPETLKDLPYCNGIAANMEYYDAFLDKLETFFHTEKSSWTRLKEVFRSVKRLPLILGAIVLVVLALGIGWFLQYPRTTEQISLTSGVISNVSYSLTCLDIMADAQHDMLEAAEEYLQTGDAAALSNAFQSCYKILTETDLTQISPTANLLDWMMDSPFSGDDLKAMHDQLSAFRDEGLGNLEYMETILTDESALALDTAEKLQVVTIYKTYLEETREAFAYATNELLIPVTREKYLETLWSDTLPYLEEIPLNGRNWSRDKKALQEAQRECLDNMEAAVQEMYLLSENEATELQQVREAMVQQLMDEGYTQARAEKIVEYSKHDWETELTQSYIRQGHSEEEAAEMAQDEAEYRRLEMKAVAAFSGKTTDDVNTLWTKLTYLLSVYPDMDLEKETEECILLYQAAMDNSDRYMPALVMYMQLKQQGTLEHGIMVMDYYAEDGKNDKLMIGDIIYQFNGENCRTVADYLAAKETLTSDSYTVKLLRMDDNREVQVLEVTLETNSPRVYLNDLLPEEDQ